MDITSLFLGPKSENNEAFKKFFDIIIEDILNFRNNYHPDETPLIKEKHKLSQPFLETQSNFISELKEVLGKLRAHSIPTWDTSYIAHMHGDLLFPAIAGYISTIMYNPNNVTGESSPVTTQWEMDFISQIGKMIGYPKFSWGHITSGGTVANIEGLWVARNLKYWPLCLKLASISEPHNYGFIGEHSFVAYNKPGRKIKDFSFTELFDLSPGIIYKLIIDLQSLYDQKNNKGKLLEAISKYSLQKLGIAGIHKKIESLCKDGKGLELPKVYIAQTKHYSWEKTLEVLGLGMGQLEILPVKSDYRLDINKLKDKIEEESKVPILAVIPVVGTTEEGIIDPVSSLVDLRAELENTIGKSFYIHADAAYGGYFSSIFYKDGIWQNSAEIMGDFEKSLLPGENFNESKRTNEEFEIKKNELVELENKIDKIRTDLLALSQVDSITIDPHKLGYIPYPAGSILFKNNMAKELITFEAPYLEWSGDKLAGADRIFLGKTTLEGSRPGAAAAACYLASRSIPLNKDGYGKIMLYTMLAANRFYNAMPKPKLKALKISIVPQFEPDTNIVCYSIAFPGVIEDPRYLNLLSNTVFDNMTKKLSTRTTSYDYFVSKTSISYSDYKEQINKILTASEIPENNFKVFSNTDDDKFFILRSVFMNPLAPGLPEEYYREFWKKVETICENEGLEAILRDLIEKKSNNRRIKVLWIENQANVENIKNEIEISSFGKYFSFHFIHTEGELKELFENTAKISEVYPIVITDLCLDGQHGKEINIKKVVPIIDSIYSNKKQIICYSRYLKNGEKNKVKEGILMELGDIHGDSFNKNQISFVGKNVDFQSENNEEKKKDIQEDMNKLFKKLILALQKIKVD